MSAAVIPSGQNPAPRDTQRIYSIAELAREFAVTARTIRFYEDEGLIKPRRQGTQRLYSAGDRALPARECQALIRTGLRR